jgi:hypothetical protein
VAKTLGASSLILLFLLSRLNQSLPASTESSEILLQEFPDLTRRGTVPHAFMKSLIVFEEYGRDTSYGAIAAALEVSS